MFLRYTVLQVFCIYNFCYMCYLARKILLLLLLLLLLQHYCYPQFTAVQPVPRTVPVPLLIDSSAKNLPNCRKQWNIQSGADIKQF